MRPASPRVRLIALSMLGALCSLGGWSLGMSMNVWPWGTAFLGLAFGAFIAFWGAGWVVAPLQKGLAELSAYLHRHGKVGNEQESEKAEAQWRSLQRSFGTDFGEIKEWIMATNRELLERQHEAGIVVANQTAQLHEAFKDADRWKASLDGLLQLLSEVVFIEQEGKILALSEAARKFFTHTTLGGTMAPKVGDFLEPWLKRSDQDTNSSLSNRESEWSLTREKSETRLSTLWMIQGRMMQVESYPLRSSLNHSLPTSSETTLSSSPHPTSASHGRLWLLREPITPSVAIAGHGMRSKSEALSRMASRVVTELEQMHSRMVTAVHQLEAGPISAITGPVPLFHDQAQESPAAESPALGRSACGILRETISQAQELLERMSCLVDAGETVACELLTLNNTIEHVASELRTELEPEATLHLALCPDPWPVSHDPAVLREIILGLCRNGVEAMAGLRGHVIISTRQLATLSPPEAEALPSGDYVMLSVTDNGHGITQKDAEQVFEPFFSTKYARGAGWTLAEMAAAVRKSGGWMDFRTEIGRGSQFRLFLPASVVRTEAKPVARPVIPLAAPASSAFAIPRALGAAESHPTISTASLFDQPSSGVPTQAFAVADRGLPMDFASIEPDSRLVPFSALSTNAFSSTHPALESQTVLVVDDDPSLRQLVKMTLRDRSYEVLEAGNADQALAHFRACEGRLKAIILDCVLPGASGQELYFELLAEGCTVPIFVCSGQVGDLREFTTPTGQRPQGFLPKPYEACAMLAALHDGLVN